MFDGTAFPLCLIMFRVIYQPYSLIFELMEIAFLHELYSSQGKMRDKMLIRESWYGVARSFLLTLHKRALISRQWI